MKLWFSLSALSHRETTRTRKSPQSAIQFLRVRQIMVCSVIRTSDTVQVKTLPELAITLEPRKCHDLYIILSYRLSQCHVSVFCRAVNIQRNRVPLFSRRRCFDI